MVCYCWPWIPSWEHTDPTAGRFSQHLESVFFFFFKGLIPIRMKSSMKSVNRQWLTLITAVCVCVRESLLFLLVGLTPTWITIQCFSLFWLCTLDIKVAMSDAHSASEGAGVSGGSLLTGLYGSPSAAWGLSARCSVFWGSHRNGLEALLQLQNMAF